MKIFILISIYLLLSCVASAQVAEVSSPDDKLRVEIFLNQHHLYYTVAYNGKTMIEQSPLGIITNEGDFSGNLSFVSSKDSSIDKTYSQEKIKKSQIHYQANVLTCALANAQKDTLYIVFQVSNNDVAFRYELPTWGDRRACVVEKEATGYQFPAHTTTYLSEMMLPMGAFARTSPSYESGYTNGDPVGRASGGGDGFVFPGLFKIGDEGWVLLSETGVSSLYCASHLSDGTADGLYTVEFPNEKQNNGFGSTGAQLALPGVTPWRIITVGETL